MSLKAGVEHLWPLTISSSLLCVVETVICRLPALAVCSHASPTLKDSLPGLVSQINPFSYAPL